METTHELTLESCWNSDLLHNDTNKTEPTLDDIKNRHTRRLNIFLDPSQDCDPAVARGINNISAEIQYLYSRHRTTYNLTSRKHSIWSLFKKHLDIPLNDAIRNHHGIFPLGLLEGFRLSTVGKTYPKWHIDTTKWVKIKNRPLNTYDWQNLLIQTTQAEETTLIPDADIILNNIKAWDQNIRFSIHCSIEQHDDCVTWEEHSRFQETLDSIRPLLSYLSFLLPQTAKDPLQIHNDINLPYRTLHPLEDSYCELCWRTTMRASKIREIEQLRADDQYLEPILIHLKKATEKAQIAKELGLSIQDVQIKIQKIKETQETMDNARIELSDRFCQEHDPRDQSSRYRTDKHYKDVFRRELQALEDYKSSIFKFRFPLPHKANEQELRKTAYDRVHVGIRPLNKLGRQSPLEQIFDLYLQGHTKSEIARKLHMTKQAVNERMNKINELLQKRQNEQFICPISEESWQKTIDSPLVKQVIDLHTKGYTISDIADETNRFKHTIQSVHRWLELSPNSHRSTQ